MLLTPWKHFEGEHPLAHLQQMYTLHSMKATLLSFGPQLGSLVSDSDRLLQGHHQDPKHSLNLYGRDSVWGSLRYQATVIQEIQKGWRPKTAQHRGGQFPLAEPVVTLERFKKNQHRTTNSSGFLFLAKMSLLKFHPNQMWNRLRRTRTPVAAAVRVTAQTQRKGHLAPKKLHQHRRPTKQMRQCMQNIAG